MREQIADAVRAAFIASRSAVDGLTYRPGIRWDGGFSPMRRLEEQPLWPRVADMLLREGGHPEMFVRAQFEALPLQSLQPTILLGSKAWERYRKYMVGYRAGLAASLASQKQAFATSVRISVELYKWSASVAWLHHLLGDEAILSPLFRYGVACTLKNSKGVRMVKERFQAAALQQYRVDPVGYDKIWGRQWIPAELRDLSRKFNVRRRKIK